MNIYRSGTFIANRYEVVQGPNEKRSLKGGMGLVYLCVDNVENGRPVALKTFLPELLPDRAARDRFLREGTTWVELGKHPHIVHCHHVFKVEVGSEVFFVLELVVAAEGKHDASLRSWLTPGKPLPGEHALLFALHIARGMKHITTKIPQLVHRDLNPRNVLVGRDGIARVTDFGLASAMQGVKIELQVTSDKENDKTNLQRTHLTRGILGTPPYMAPEQWTNATLDTRADIYAFGCMLYEMISGRFAVSGDNLKTLAAAHQAGWTSTLGDDMPEDVVQLLKQCSAVKSDDRFGNWREVEAEVAAAYEQVSGHSVPQTADAMADGHADELELGWSYNTISKSYFDIGKFVVAKDYLEKVLKIAQSEQNQRLEAAAVANLGNVHLHLGDARRAIEYHKRALEKLRGLDDLHAVAENLRGLGSAYSQHGDTRRGIESLEQAREILHAIGDRLGEGQIIGNIGTLYLESGNAREAVRHYEVDLKIEREFGDQSGESRALGNLGAAYSQLREPQQAFEYCSQHLSLTREIADRFGEGRALGNLATVYLQVEDLTQATTYFTQAISIMTEVGDLWGVALSNLNLAPLLAEQGQLPEALLQAENALNLFTTFGISQYIERAQTLVDQIRSKLG